MILFRSNPGTSAIKECRTEGPAVEEGLQPKLDPPQVLVLPGCSARGRDKRHGRPTCLIRSISKGSGLSMTLSY